MDDRLKLTIPIVDIEQSAVEQIKNALKLPYLKRLAIMPDVHAGYDLPIGGVALLDGHIWPGAVGYDIGCGMCFVDTKTNINNFNDKGFFKEVYNRITRMVPVGFETLKTPNNNFKKFPNATGYAAVYDAVSNRASYQIGTLGGGNHFIEIGVNKTGNIGITIHSGSRRAGWLIGDFYMRMSGGPIKLDSALGQSYLTDMDWALQYALDNRLAMMEKCIYALGLDKTLLDGVVNENHNHAVVTEEGVLHRKGATPANYGQTGIIPANMRDGVYITFGLGNEEYLSSASHGAGRMMSRGKAKKVLNVDALKEQMNGVVTPELTDKILDEAPDAYKDISEVLGAQDSILVDVVDHYKPLLVVKG